MSDHSETSLLWLDLETTGLDVDQDEIIEVACTLTDVDLDPLPAPPAPWGLPDHGSVRYYQAVVWPSDRALGRLLRNPQVLDMHTDNGLLDEVLAATPANDIVGVDAYLRWWVDAYAPGSQLVLAGSGVGHFDLAFVRRQMPKLYSRLAYWVIDVGIIRRSLAMWINLDREAPERPVAETHRGWPDVQAYLEEARAYRRLIRAGWEAVTAQ